MGSDENDSHRFVQLADLLRLCFGGVAAGEQGTPAGFQRLPDSSPAPNAPEQLLRPNPSRQKTDCSVRGELFFFPLVKNLHCLVRRRRENAFESYRALFSTGENVVQHVLEADNELSAARRF